MKQYTNRIALMWAAIMAGLAMHTLADLLPLFWNEPVAVDLSGEAPVCMLVAMTVLSYTLPVVGLLCAMYVRGRCGAVINLILAVLMLLFNLFHLSEVFYLFAPVQLFILPMILLVSVLLLVDSLKWWRMAASR